MTDNKSEKKDSFIVRKKYRRYIQKLSVDQRLNLLEDIFLYQTEGKFEEKDGAVSMLMDIMIDDRKRDADKYEDVCKKNKEIALEREKKKRERQDKKREKHEKHDRAKSYTNDTKSTEYEYDYDYEYDSDKGLNDLSISSNEEIEQSSSITSEINNLIDLIKQQCDSLGIAYDKQKDRYFAKFILTAKEYGAFAEKIGQTRVEFALNVLKASFQIKFRKGICSGPMKIYQNYAEVYNETLKQHSKNQKNLIQSF